MRRGWLLFIITIVCGGCFFILNVWSAPADIIINEIGAYETSGYEWIEIWNAGTESIDILKWKFFENNINHGLSVSSTDSILEPNEFAVICQDDNLFFSKYPFFTGSIFDSSWGSLSENGEEIGLKDDVGNIITLFTYPSAKKYSLERIDPFSDPNDVNNWRLHSASNSVGFINESYLINNSSTPIIDEEEIDEEEIDEEEIDDEIIPEDDIEDNNEEDSFENHNDDWLWRGLKINEFVSDPITGNEWVEIYQTESGSLDLSAALICDNRETVCKKVSGTIEASGFLVVDLQTTSFLNNNGDSVILKNSSGVIFDWVNYFDPYLPKKGQSLARKIDGVDTDSINDWAITDTITRGTSNIITSPTNSEIDGVGGNIIDDLSIDDVGEMQQYNFNDLIINEILPNPVGVDTDNEYIEIKNLTDKIIDLSGWKIGDNARKYKLSSYIQPGEILYYLRSETKIALNNSGYEKVVLLAPNSEVIDMIEYTSTKEGYSYGRDIDLTWHWSEQPTPGAENIFPVLMDGGIIWQMTAPLSGLVGELLIFEAEDSIDERGGELLYSWDFGDGIILFGGEVVYQFPVAGKYQVKVVASSTSISRSVKEFIVDIKDEIKFFERGVYLSEVLTNPAGDETNEFIELFNSENFSIDISGWYLKNNNKKYIFPIDTIIEPQNFLPFFRQQTGIILNNQGAQVELFNQKDELVDMIKIGAAKDGYSYIWLNEKWQWTNKPTPNLANTVLLSVASTASSASVKKAVALPETMSIEMARTKNIGSKVKVRGVVSVLPGIFGTQYFYINNQFAGIQIYSYKKDFPELKVGDLVEVTGEISEAQGAKRIKTTSKEMIDILETENNIVTPTLNFGDINLEDAGRLVKIQGEITDIKTNYLYLDDGFGELKVYFKNGTNIKKQELAVGMMTDVIGVLEVVRNVVEIWPRSQADIVLHQIVENQKEDNSNINHFFQKQYLLLAGALAIIGGYVVRKKRAYLISLFKKIFSK